jgi:formylglycine-generating enzyme required for sulfatase activity
MEFVSIPAGSFRMGSSSSEAFDDEQPVHEVRISRGFELGKYEVTQAEWEAVMGSNASHFQGQYALPRVDPGSLPVDSVYRDDPAAQHVTPGAGSTKMPWHPPPSPRRT